MAVIGTAGSSNTLLFGWKWFNSDDTFCWFYLTDTTATNIRHHMILFNAGLANSKTCCVQQVVRLRIENKTLVSSLYNRKIGHELKTANQCQKEGDKQRDIFSNTLSLFFMSCQTYKLIFKVSHWVSSLVTPLLKFSLHSLWSRRQLKYSSYKTLTGWSQRFCL